VRRKPRPKPTPVIALDLMPETIDLGTTRVLLTAYFDPRNRPNGVVHARLQADVDALLRQVLFGRDPRAVFALDGKKKRGARDVRLKQAMCAEVMRLTLDLTEAAAKNAVAQRFGVDNTTVDRAVRAWRERLTDKEWFLEGYVHNLKLRKLI
jgi:hypothetical protein